MASPDSKFAKLEDARWYLKTARALAHMWADASADGDALGLWKQEGFAVLGDDDDDRGFRWLNFTTALNAGLEPFQAHVNYKGITEPFADLYNGACHQIFNLMVGGHTARHCEKCGRVFVHQLGGAKYRQHRVDARYCTPACARAEASRQYRRRKAAQRKDRR